MQDQLHKFVESLSLQEMLALIAVLTQQALKVTLDNEPKDTVVAKVNSNILLKKPKLLKETNGYR